MVIHIIKGLKLITMIDREEYEKTKIAIDNISREALILKNDNERLKNVLVKVRNDMKMLRRYTTDVEHL